MAARCSGSEMESVRSCGSYGSVWNLRSASATERAVVNAITAAAGLAVAAGGLAASISGAGADATNTILTTTRAFLLDSSVRAATDVMVTLQRYQTLGGRRRLVPAAGPV